MPTPEPTPQQIDPPSAGQALPWRALGLSFLWASLWVNASEVARYFLLVMPEVRLELAALPGVAPMSVPVFLVWGVWDSLLVVMLVTLTWLVTERFGRAWRHAVSAGTLAWLFFFGLFWLAMVNMALASPGLAASALLWAWVEMVTGAGIVIAVLRARPA